MLPLSYSQWFAVRLTRNVETNCTLIPPNLLNKFRMIDKRVAVPLELKH